MAAPIVLIFGVCIASLTWDGYSHQAQMISELGGVEAPIPTVQNFVYFLVGSLVVAFAMGLNAATRSRWGSVFLGYSASHW